ncbi:MAG: hypothetical protein J1F22_03440 [Lachnospiraceae bacterium]|nr:hypothetical protein [Lachnospiraceae bacterium]
MKNKLYLLLVAVLCCFILSACGENSSGGGEIIAYEYENGGDVTIANDSLSLTVSGSSTQVAITDKKSGKTYRSNPSAADIAKYANATGQHKDILSATLGLTYSNITDTQKEIDNYGSCIINGNYNIEKVSETEVKVSYSIGDFEKTYACPVAIKESRMNEYLEKMDRSAQSSVKRYYNYYNYEELTGEFADDISKQTLAEAEELFPDLQDEPIYYLTSDITDAKLQSCEKYFQAVGYTVEDRVKDMGTYEVSRNDGKPVFDISIHYVLEDDQLLVKVPMNEIQYNEDYPLVKLEVLPYMAAGSTAEKGYLIVPDGMGGLIRFNNGKIEQQTYQSDLYGWDYGQSRSMIVDETKSNFPVFAISNETEKDSVLCISEAGSSYATVEADIAGKKNGYNYSSFVYKMVHGETMDVASKSDATVRVYEDGLPDETIIQRYIFSTDTEYSKLAAVYREYLMKRYPELTKKEKSEVPLAVEMIGAVDDTEHILGYPVVRSQSLTSYEQAQTILKSLKEAGIGTISAKYTGWFNGGVKQTSSKKVSLVGRLGSKSDLTDLTAYAESTDGLDLFLNGNFMYVYKDKLFDGFGPRSNAAKFCSRELCELYTLDPVTYQANDDYINYHNYDTYYLVKPSYSMEAIDSYLEDITDYGTKNIGFEDMGSQLAGDYNPKNRVSREASMNLQADKMKSLKGSGSKVMITGGNQYAVPYADFVTDLNIASKPVNLIDEQIPFYQMALHGLVDYSGAALNLSQDEEENILKSAETGAGLYYTYIYEDTSVLQNGRYTRYYACNFDQWKEDTVNLYNKFTEQLGDTYNQFITEHEQVADGVYKTTYENGKTVLVNYSYEDYDYQGTSVPKRDFVTIGGEK